MTEPNAAEHNLHRRIDTQDTLLREIRDMLVAHIAADVESKRVEAPVARALDEIVILWRASKVLIPILVTISVGLWAFIQWWKEHVR